MPPGLRIKVSQRIVDGPMVIDQEEFTGIPTDESPSTWIYQVRGGLIQRAWTLDGAAAAAP